MFTFWFFYSYNIWFSIFILKGCFTFWIVITTPKITFCTFSFNQTTFFTIRTAMFTCLFSSSFNFFSKLTIIIFTKCFTFVITTYPKEFSIFTISSSHNLFTTSWTLMITFWLFNSYYFISSSTNIIFIPSIATFFITYPKMFFCFFRFNSFYNRTTFITSIHFTRRISRYWFF